MDARHGVRFQPSLSGALHTARTNAFFMGGGKALVNAYYRSAERLGVQVRYDAPVERLELHDGRFVAACVGDERIEARSCVLAAGGFESNREWLREAWGVDERGEHPADNFLIRGTRFNTGVLLRFMIDAGADTIGDPTQAHMVAIDARAPLYDGGICTRIDCVSLGVVVNRDAAALLRRRRGLLAQALRDLGPPGGAAARADRLLDHRCQGGRALHAAGVSRHDGRHAWTSSRARSGSTRRASCARCRRYNAACRPGRFDHTVLDDCATEGLTPPKTHWARPIDTPPFYGYRAAARASRSPTSGLKVDETRRGAFRRHAEPQPVRRRRDDGGQRARPGLHRRRRHEHRHRLRPHRRHAGRAGGSEEGADAAA